MSFGIMRLADFTIRVSPSCIKTALHKHKVRNASPPLADIFKHRPYLPQTCNIAFLKRPSLHRPAVAARKVVIHDRQIASCW
jgi:hypothetical protein